jgi:hypothetical protein
MSQPHVIVYTPQGPAHIRQDTAEELGIARGERIGTKLWRDAVDSDYRRNLADRKRA